MEDLKILSEITTRYGNRNVNELEFKTPEDFKKYKAKHKMRPGTVVKVAGKDKVVGDEPKKAKRKNVPLDFQMANEKEIKQMAKKYGLEVDSIEGNPNAGLQANLTGDKEALKKFMTSDDYGMDDRDAEDHFKEFGSDVEDKKSPSDKPKKSKDFNGVDYEKMKGKEPGTWDRQAVYNLTVTQVPGEEGSGKLKNPELKKELGFTDSWEGNQEIINNLDLAQISDIVDRYGDDYDKESHMERLKDDHGLGGKPDVDPKTDKEMQKVASDANEKMAKDEFANSVTGDAMSAGEIFDKNKKHIPKKLRDEAQEAIFAIMDAEMGMITDEDADWAKDFLKKDILPHIKEGKDFDLRQLSKITTRYNKWLN